MLLAIKLRLWGVHFLTEKSKLLKLPTLLESCLTLNKCHADLPTGREVHHIALTAVCIVMEWNRLFQSYLLCLQSWGGPHSCKNMFLTVSLISSEICAFSVNIYVWAEDFHSWCFLEIKKKRLKSAFDSKVALTQNFNKPWKRFSLQKENQSLKSQIRYWAYSA